MGEYRIALVPGDGIGPEVAAPAVELLEAAGKRFGHRFSFTSLEAGGAAIDKYGVPLPEGAIEKAADCGALLLGAVGGPRWDALPGGKRPERALLDLRKGLGVFANLRPAVLLPQLRDASPLKDEILAAGPGASGGAKGGPDRAGFDLLIVRELTGGLYFGDRGRSEDGRSAFDTERYSAPEIERLLTIACGAARRRRKKLTIVDKANVLESSRLWREVAEEVTAGYPDVAVDFLYVDNAAMQLIRAPGRFDVIATSNLFGDILSDEASALTGSIGLLPSASVGEERGGLRFGMYEPIHGSAPDIAGKNIANPLGMILSTAMMLRYSFGLEEEAAAVEAAVSAALDAGLRTADIARRGETSTGTREMGEAVIEAFTKPA
ncbi:MAG: 3-isopropylmalate dehydrogenase [Treponema sp.]|jgi:3-isopropylmalate dehydrogenase|nr:3-isopropylmalate dehydrogenase [Treponema sp.]